MTEAPSVRAATMNDLDAVVVLLNKESTVFAGEAKFTAEDLTQQWTVPGFNLERDTRIAVTADGRTIAYAEVVNVRRPPVRPFA